VQAGHVGIMDPSITFDIQMVSGFKNIVFGGEGLFLAKLTGPGHVALQSMPIMNLANEIARYLPATSEISSSSSSGSALGVTTGVVGGLLGGMLGKKDDSTGG